MPDSTPNTNIPQKPPERKPAYQLVMDFCKFNNISIVIRRPNIRFLEDNGMIIDPPGIIAVYNDEVNKPKIEIAN